MTSPGNRGKDAAVGQVRANESPDSKTVVKFHRHADTDASHDAAHHTTGYGENQAAPGTHDHRDGKGAPLLADVVLTGNVTLNTATVLDQVCAALALLGAIDSTTGP